MKDMFLNFSFRRPSRGTVESAIVFLIVAVAALVACSAMFSSAGCQGFRPFQGVQESADGKQVLIVSPELKQQLEAFSGKLDEVKTTADQALAQAQATGDVEQIQQAQSFKTTVDQAVQARDKGQQVIVTDAASGGVDLVGTAASAAGLLPPPWNVLGPTLVVIAGSLFQGMRRAKTETVAVEAQQKAVETQEAAVSIVKHIDTMAIKDPKVMTALKHVDDKAKLEAHQQLTPLAMELIDSNSVT